MDRLFQFLFRLEGVQAAVVLALFPLLEASAFAGIAVPGETALVIGGVLVHQGRVSFVAMALAGTVGAVVGDSIGYWVGRRWGQRVMNSRVSGIIGQERWDRARQHLQRRGFAAVVLGRFPPAVRTLVPLLAGSARMPYRRFFVANLIGGTVWTIASISLGWIAGAAWQQVHGIAMLVIVLVFAVMALAIGLRRRRRDRARLDESSRAS